MKSFIKHRIRTFINEQKIDGENMNPAMQNLCNTMSVSTYDEVIQMVTQAIGTQQQNPMLWVKIQKPLRMLQQSNSQINQEKHINNMGNHVSQPWGMTGDSMVDEANTWWTAIQTTLCEQGSNFV